MSRVSILGLVRRRASWRRGGTAASSSRAAEPARPDVADAHLTMMLTQESIAGADGKASILGTAAAVVVGLVASSLDLATLGESGLGTASALLGVLGLALLLVTGVELAGVLVPRVSPEGFSRYAWPAITDVPLARLVDADPAADRTEAWAQAQMLARIAARKHLHLRRAMTWFGVTVVVITAWALLGTLVP